MPVAFWVHEPTPFLGCHWGNFGIGFYGLGYLLGFLAAVLFFAALYAVRKIALTEGKDSDLMVALVLGVMKGGRLGSALLYSNFDQLRSDPLSFFRVWESGMASHGGFIGVTVALWWFSWRHAISFFHLGDLIVSAVPVGILLVRIANFLNGELWGKVTTVPWAVIFEKTRGGPFPRHPSQLYEAALEGALLLAWMQWRLWRTNVVRYHPGQLVGEFLITYSLVQMFGEIFREPDASLILGVSRGTFYSILLILAGLALIAHARRNPAATAF